MASSAPTQDQRSSLEQSSSQDRHTSLEDESVPPEKISIVQTRAKALVDHREGLIAPKRARPPPKHHNAAGPSRHSTISSLPQGRDAPAHTYPPPSADVATAASAARDDSGTTDAANETQKSSFLFRFIFAMCPPRKQTESLA
ncbi:unnamed protein product [Peniophora sp. CBMAI 1063]|nr:unnamed protein product [Peniophora sp. CBMAI 1063]